MGLEKCSFKALDKCEEYSSLTFAHVGGGSHLPVVSTYISPSEVYPNLPNITTFVSLINASNKILLFFVALKSFLAWCIIISIIIFN